jgi:hypothetical protein
MQCLEKLAERRNFLEEHRKALGSKIQEASDLLRDAGYGSYDMFNKPEHIVSLPKEAMYDAGWGKEKSVYRKYPH